MRRKPPRLVRILRVKYRRAFSRMDQNTPEWMRLLTPWMTSLSLHGVVLLLLAFSILASTGEPEKEGPLVASLPDQLMEDITALQPADQAGDPFAKEEMNEAPSLSLDPSMVDESVTNLPELPPDFILAKDLQMSSGPAGEASKAVTIAPTGAAGPGGFAGMAAGDGAMTAPFAGRSTQMRARLARRNGGSVFSEQSVTRGLNWIVRHQMPDGRWSLNHRLSCKGAGCPSDKHADSDSAATGLALLPLLAAGRIHNEPGEYSKNVKTGLDWLVKNQKPDGDLWTGGGGNTHMYSHAIAAMALCEAYGVSKDETIRGPAQKAIDFIIKAQNQNDGGWRYNPGEAGDTCVFGWQMFALRSGALAGLDVPLEPVKKCRMYLDKAKADEYGATYAYQPNNQATPTMSAEGLLCRQYLGWQKNYPALLTGSERIFGELQKGFEIDENTGAVNLKSRNIYFWYYATQLLHNLQGPMWVQWNVQVRDSLVFTQNTTNSCAKGSWDPTLVMPDGRRLEDAWGKEAGRLFVTSLSMLTLEVYYRYLPIYQARDRDSLGSGAAKEKEKDAK